MAMLQCAVGLDLGPAHYVKITRKLMTQAVAKA